MIPNTSEEEENQVTERIEGVSDARGVTENVAEREKGEGGSRGKVVETIVNIQPTPVQWAVRKGGGLTYRDSLNSSGNDNNAFVCCAGHSQYNTWRHSIQCK